MKNKTKINVIDLDETLISYDSFRYLIIQELKAANFQIICLTVLRITRLISNSKYKEKVSKQFVKNYDEDYFIDFASKLYKTINQSVFDIIKSNTDSETTNILLTASPNFFAQHLIEKLNWLGSGSFFNSNGDYVHLYGEEKITWLTDKFNKDKFDYNFAISDSSSDDKLLSLFSKKIRWNKNNLK